jgi:hypothetical protein
MARHADYLKSFLFCYRLVIRHARPRRRFFSVCQVEKDPFLKRFFAFYAWAIGKQATKQKTRKEKT